MAWVRLHDGAMQSLKVARLSDSAFRLWIRGLCYCQTALTDGLIPHEALRDMGAKRKDVDELATPQIDGRSSLWAAIDRFGFKVHDYLEWNDSREKVTGRLTAAKARKTTYDLKRKGTRSDTRSEHVEGRVTNAHGGFGLVCTDLPKRKDLERESEGEPPAKRNPFTDATVTERAGRFIERYEMLYRQHRGARYLVRDDRDYHAAVPLCATWTDDARLDKLAAIFLTTDNDFAANGSRTIAQFAALASWCDSQLAQWEARHQVSA